jgi:hypothetical protein
VTTERDDVTIERAAVDPSACLRCGGTLQSMGVRQIRVGGTSGGWKLLFGEWAELGEGMIDLEFLVCEACRQVELRAPGPG